MEMVVQGAYLIIETCRMESLIEVVRCAPQGLRSAFRLAVVFGGYRGADGIDRGDAFETNTAARLVVRSARLRASSR